MAMLPFVSLMLDTLNDYNEQTTSGIIGVNKQHLPFKMLLVSEWLDISKLMDKLPEMQQIDPALTDKELMNEEQVPNVTPWYLMQPTMCQYLHALLLASGTAWPIWNEQAHVQMRIKKFDNILNNMKIVKNEGIMALMLNMSLNVDHIVTRVTDVNNGSIPYTITPIYIGGNIGFEIEVGAANGTIYGSIGRGIFLHMYPFTGKSSYCKTWAENWFLSIYTDRDEMISGDKTRVELARERNHKVDVTGQVMKLKPTQNRTCLTHHEYKPSCAWECILAQDSPCTCAVFGATSSPPIVKNVSTLCHAYESSDMNRCSNMISPIEQKNLFGACDESCGRPCEKVIFRASVASRSIPASTEPDSLVPLHIEVKFSTDSADLSIEEFYLHDIPSVLSTAAGIVSLLIGMSFLNLFSWLPN